MRAKVSNLSWLACIAVLAISTPAARANGYGFDLVPESHFHNDSWTFYGSDLVPTSSTQHNDYRTTYGWDPIPDMTHPHVYDRQNVLLLESVQQLTAARENVSAKAREKAPAKAVRTNAPAPVAKQSINCAPSR